MLICNHCGRTIEDYPTYKQTHGNSYAEEVINENCPHCGRGEFVEAKRCPCCREWESEEKLLQSGGVCEDCLDGYALPEYAVDFGDNNREEITVNGFIKFALSEIEINNVLFDYLKKHPKNYAHKARAYCLNDKSAFGEYIANTEI